MKALQKELQEACAEYGEACKSVSKDGQRNKAFARLTRVLDEMRALKGGAK